MEKRFVVCVKSDNGSTTIGKTYELDENGHFTFDIGLRSLFPFNEYECVGVYFDEIVERVNDERVSDEHVSETLTFEVKPDAPLYRGTLTAVKWLLENTISIKN